MTVKQKHQERMFGDWFIDLIPILTPGVGQRNPS